MGVKKDLPFYQCPRYAKCSLNNCPLHPGYPNLIADPEDVEQKCGISKNVRTRIAAEFPAVLKFEGLTSKEFTAKRVWESLSLEEQEARKNKMASVRASITAKNSNIEIPQPL